MVRLDARDVSYDVRRDDQGRALLRLESRLGLLLQRLLLVLGAFPSNLLQLVELWHHVDLHVHHDHHVEQQHDDELMRTAEQSRAANQRHYAKHKDRILGQRRARQAFVAWLKASPCLDCQHAWPSVAMDFDHRDPSTKVYDVTKWAFSNWTIEKLQAEVMKCDVVCACCHRLRTHGQRRVLQ